MLTPKTDFLGTGPILYVCEIVFGLQETPIFCHILNHLCHLEPKSHYNTCTRLDLSAADCDQITSVVEYRVCRSKSCRH